MKRTILYCVASSLILFVASFYLINEIYNFFFSLFKASHLQFVAQQVSSPFVSGLKLSASVGIIPLLLLIAWMAGRITTLRRRSFSILIVMVCIWLAFMVNIFRIKSQEMVMTNLPAHVYFPLEALYFEYAIFMGALAGAVISYFIFKGRTGSEALREINAIGNN